MNILVVDDIDERHLMARKLHEGANIISAYTPNKACEILAFSDPDFFDIIYLDHDAGGELTFYPVVCLLVALKKAYSDKEFPQVRIISVNPPASEKMQQLMESVSISALKYNFPTSSNPYRFVED